MIQNGCKELIGVVGVVGVVGDINLGLMSYNTVMQYGNFDPVVNYCLNSICWKLS